MKKTEQQICKVTSDGDIKKKNVLKEEKKP